MLAYKLHPLPAPTDSNCRKPQIGNGKMINFTVQLKEDKKMFFFFAFMFGRLVQRMSPIFGKCCPYVASHSGHDMRLLALFFPHFERVFARPRQGNLTDTQNRKLSVSTTNTATVFRGLMNGRWQIKWKLDKILFMYFCLRSDDKLFEAEK